MIYKAVTSVRAGSLSFNHHERDAKFYIPVRATAASGPAVSCREKQNDAGGGPELGGWPGAQPRPAAPEFSSPVLRSRPTEGCHSWRLFLPFPLGKGHTHPCGTMTKLQGTSELEGTSGPLHVPALCQFTNKTKDTSKEGRTRPRSPSSLAPHQDYHLAFCKRIFL